MLFYLNLNVNFKNRCEYKFFFFRLIFFKIINFNFLNKLSQINLKSPFHYKTVKQNLSIKVININFFSINNPINYLSIFKIYSFTKYYSEKKIIKFYLNACNFCI